MKKCKSCQSKIDDKAKKCPHCRADQRNWFARHKIITFIISIIFLSGFISGLTPSSKSSSQNNINTPTPEVISEEYKISLAESFCKNRKGEYYSGVFLCGGCVDLNDMINNSNLIHNAKAPATVENCQKITDLCLKKWSKEECQKMAEKKIWMGMSGLQLYLSWGIPEDQNNTVTPNNFNTQWVYGSGNYVYLDGENREDAIVTSWQD